MDTSIDELELFLEKDLADLNLNLEESNFLKKKNLSPYSDNLHFELNELISTSSESLNRFDTNLLNSIHYVKIHKYPYNSNPFDIKKVIDMKKNDLKMVCKPFSSTNFHYSQNCDDLM